MKKLLHHKENIVLLYLALITGIYPVLLTPSSLQKLFILSSFYSVIFHYLGVFLFFFLIPFSLIRWVFHASPGDFGLSFKNFRASSRLILVLLPLLTALIWLSSRHQDFQSEYPLYRGFSSFGIKLLIMEMAYLFYYIGWEFLFRGFVLFSLEKKGAGLAILVQTIPSTLLHYSKPPGEIILAMVAGIILGYYVLKYRNIAFAIILHFSAGLMMDVFCLINGSTF
ncbi:MAG: CPBP family intramembrane metalloprotease [Spirochaetes bacterium]|nr:CPBP family intramembrane metalloprotease [Spirochaetota bacterium]